MQAENRTSNAPTAPMGIRRLARTAALGASVASLAACSFSFGDSFDGVAVEVIEGDLTDRLQLGELSDAECDDPGDGEVGSTFECTAQTDDGDTVEFTAEIISDDEVRVTPTNALAPADFDDIESGAPGELGAPSTSVQCPDEGAVLAGGESVSCEITDVDGVVYELIVTIDAAEQQVLYEVGDPIG